MRRYRSNLLSRVEVHRTARRAGHLRAGSLSLFSMHPRPANLLSTPGFWHTLFCTQLCNASVVLVVNAPPEAPGSR